MKKVWVGLTLVVIIITIFLLTRSNAPVDSDEDEFDDTEIIKAFDEKKPKNVVVNPVDTKATQKFIQEARANKKPDTEKPQNIVPKVGDRILSDSELEELDEYFEKVENEWEESIRNLFLKEFGLAEDDLKDYEEMRDKYETDKLEAFQDFHEYMVEKHGENYVYNPSDDELNFDDKVKFEYQDQLRKKVGDYNFKKYIKLVDKFNERLKREQDPYKGTMTIDF